MTQPVPADSQKWQPDKHAMPQESPPELVVPDAVSTDERIWVPVDDHVWFRPLCLSASRGYWIEHDWVVTEGAYVYEAPGETHTLVVDPHVDEMITTWLGLASLRAFLHPAGPDSAPAATMPMGPLPDHR